MQLLVPDIDGIDTARTALEQHVGKTTSRRADVETDTVPGVDLRMIESGCELHAATRDVRVGGCRAQNCVEWKLQGSLGDDRIVSGHKARGDRRLRLGAAFEQAALDEQQI